MASRRIRDPQGSYDAWSVDQLTKSAFFHQKLHDWELTEVAKAIESVRGEELSWDTEQLGVSAGAWNKVIHRGIKPVVVFAHPAVLQNIPRAVSYYRMLAMVSQKSMSNLRLNVTRFEEGHAFPDNGRAWEIASPTLPASWKEWARP